MGGSRIGVSLCFWVLKLASWVPGGGQRGWGDVIVHR